MSVDRNQRTGVAAMIRASTLMSNIASANAVVVYDPGTKAIYPSRMPIYPSRMQDHADRLGRAPVESR